MVTWWAGTRGPDVPITAENGRPDAHLELFRVLARARCWEGSWPRIPLTNPPSSMGTTIFVDGEVPTSLRVSRYCSRSVVASRSLPTVEILSNPAARPSARRMADWRSPFRAEDRSLPIALGQGDRRLLLTLRLGDHGAAGALGRHLACHRLEDAGRRVHFPDFHGRDLHAPALRDIVEPDTERGVHLLPLRQHVVEDHVTDHTPQRRRRDVLRGHSEVLHLEHGHGRGRRPCRR